MTIKFANNASTTVAGSITASDTTVNVAAGTGIFFPPIIAGSGNFFCLTFYDQATKTINEIVHCTNVSGDTFTIVRGQEGTTPRAWTSGDILANLITAGTLDAFVQAGPVAANASLIYTGIDISTDAHHIVCNTNPVPAAYQPGMVFTIKVGGSWTAGTLTNPGAVDCQFNGVPAVLAKRTNGSDLIPGNFVPNQEYIFVYNGTFFSTTMQPAPQSPPQTTFYVRSDAVSTVNMTTGLETGNGLANTVQDAFKTLQGALNTIMDRYISEQIITVRVADGTYTSGVQVVSSYMAGWNFVGNAANPGNVIINCTSTADGTYVPGSCPGVCFQNLPGGNLSINGFSCQSYSFNILNNGLMYCSNIKFRSPTSGLSSMFQNAIGTCGFSGYIEANSYNGNDILFAVAGGVINLGWDSAYASQRKTITLHYNYQLYIVLDLYFGGAASVYDNLLTLSYTVAPVYGWVASLGGGCGFMINNNNLGAPGLLVGTEPGGWYAGA